MLKFKVKKACTLLLSAAFLFAGCSDDAKKKSTVFVVGTDDVFPPMGYRNAHGELVGYDIDLATEVASRLNLEVKFHPIVEWSERKQLLENGTIDCIWASYTITPERAKKVLFTPPYLENTQIFLVKGDSGYKTATDLEGKIVGAQTATSGETAIRANTELLSIFSEQKSYVAYEDAVKALETGEIDALVIDLLVAIDNIKYKKKPFRILDNTIAMEQYGIGFRLSDVELRDNVWRTLQAMQADGTVDNISKKWFGQDLSVIQ